MKQIYKISLLDDAIHIENKLSLLDYTNKYYPTMFKFQEDITNLEYYLEKNLDEEVKGLFKSLIKDKELTYKCEAAYLNIPCYILAEETENENEVTELVTGLKLNTEHYSFLSRYKIKEGEPFTLDDRYTERANNYFSNYLNKIKVIKIR